MKKLKDSRIYNKNKYDYDELQTFSFSTGERTIYLCVE